MNSRFLDLQFRIADELRAHEPLLRELISARISRGKVDCRLSLVEGTEQAASRLNPQALGRLRTLAEAAQSVSASRAAAPRRRPSLAGRHGRSRRR